MPDEPTQTPPPPPENTPPPPPPPPAPPAGPTDLDRLSNLLAALPERVAHAVREGMPQAPAQTQTPPPAEPPKADPPKADPPKNDTKPGPRNFAEWWFHS